VNVDLPSRAQAAAAIAREHSAWGDEHGRLAEPVVEALHREGLYGMWVPRTVRGGAELDPIPSLRVLETVSHGDPSAGWVLMAAALAIGTGAAYLRDEAVAELFERPRLPVIAGQGTRPGTAMAQDGGFLLSGSWSFGSGLFHATHIHTLGIIEGTNEPRIFVLPIEKAALKPASWDVLGLRATGSIDYTIDRAFVPDGFTHFAVTERPLRGGSLYTLGIIGFAGMAHSAWACGIGRRMLDELQAYIGERVGRAGTLVESDAFQQDYAKAEGTYRSARALVFETWADIQETLRRGDALSVRQHTLMRLAMAHATWSAQDVAAFVYKSAGTLALRAGTIQRLFRDMHAGTQHVTSAPPVFRAIGRELAGLASDKKWLFLDLI
jgi:alkylation response protein AidB-like acyl-CoA dehydrogenase